MGHEGAGVVEAVGRGLDPRRRRAVGRALLVRAVPPLPRVPARAASGCAPGSPSLRHAQADGTTRLSRPDGSPVLAYLSIGTMASAQVVPATAVVPMPDGVPPEVAALIGCGVSTGVGAVVKTAEVPAGVDGRGHRPRRRGALVRHGRGARGGAADRRGGREPGQDRPRRAARRHALGPRRPGGPARRRSTGSATRPATAARTSCSRRSGCRPRSPRRSPRCRRAGRPCSSG